MLKHDDRLAIPHANGERKRTAQGWSKYWSPFTKFALMNRLGEYEDLGYTPGELREMIEEVRAYEDLGSIEELREMIEKGGWIDDGK